MRSVASGGTDAAIWVTENGRCRCEPPTEYSKAGLIETADPDPLRQFAHWFAAGSQPSCPSRTPRPHICA